MNKYSILKEKVKRIINYKGEYRFEESDNLERFKYSISIVTYEKRFVDHLIPLLKGIDKCPIPLEVVLMINGNYQKAFNDTYKKELIEFLLTLKNVKVYPQFFMEFTSLAKLWNLSVLNSSYPYSLVMNDDVIITDIAFFSNLNKLIEEYQTSFIINSSFSHFVVKKEELVQVGFFDERYLGVGEEDGDFYFRYHEKLQKDMFMTTMRTIHNNSVMDADENVKKGVGKYSKFNREFSGSKYTVDENGYQGQFLFSAPIKKIIDDSIQYPYEDFVLKNKQNL